MYDTWHLKDLRSLFSVLCRVAERMYRYFHMTIFRIPRPQLVILFGNGVDNLAILNKCGLSAHLHVHSVLAYPTLLELDDFVAPVRVIKHVAELLRVRHQ